MFTLFKCNSLFLYKEFSFNQYFHKLNLAFIRVLSTCNLNIQSNLLPTDVYISRSSTDFFMSLEFPYYGYSSFKDLKFPTLSRVLPNKNFGNDCIPFCSRIQVSLTLPFDYVRH